MRDHGYTGSALRACSWVSSSSMHSATISPRCITLGPHYPRGVVQKAMGRATSRPQRAGRGGGGGAGAGARCSMHGLATILFSCSVNSCCLTVPTSDTLERILGADYVDFDWLPGNIHDVHRLHQGHARWPASRHETLTALTCTRKKAFGRKACTGSCGPMVGASRHRLVDPMRAHSPCPHLGRFSSRGPDGQSGELASPQTDSASHGLS